MQFLEPAPAHLTQDGTTFYADWSVADTNFGYTKSQVEGWVASALNDSRGLLAAGITPRQVTSGNTIFQVVEEIDRPPGEDAIGIAYWNDFPVLVELEAALFGNQDLVTHEALHSFLLANHSPEGSDSLLEPIEDPGEEWLSPGDIAEIEAWLSGAPADLTYWFPGDLEHYITKWSIPAGARTRLSANIIDGSSCVLKAVWWSDHLAMIGGDYQQFGRGLDLGRSGFFHTSWQSAPVSGDTYIGLIIDGATTEDFDRLVIAHAEVQIVGAELTGGGDPIPN